MIAIGKGRKPEPARFEELLHLPLNPDLVLVMQTFIDLQGARHDADYDVVKRFTRSEARNWVTKAQDAFLAWTRAGGVADSDNARLLMAAFVLKQRTAT